MAKKGVDSKAAIALYQGLARKARQNVNVFIEFVFRFKQSDVHEKLQAHMAGYGRAGIIAQKELGKTTQAIGRVLWRLGRNPNLLIKLVCASDDLAVDRIMLLRDMMQRNRFLRMVFPDLKKHPGFDDWGKKSLTVKRDIFSKDSSIEACGILTAGTGGRADEVIFDDIVDFQNAIRYPQLREQVKVAFRNIWIPLLGPHGVATYLATKHHEADLTHELLENKAWTWVDYSVTGEPPISHWPEKWTTEALEGRRTEIGSIEFDRTMRNVVHSDSERIVKKHWIRTFQTQPDRGSLRITSWDFSASGNAGDWTSRSLIELSFQERLMRVTRIDRWRGLTFNGIIDLMLSDFGEWKPDHVLVENTGFQVAIGRDERITELPLEKIVPKVGKEQRVRQTAVLYERGMILFMEGTCAGGVEELLAFPKGKHDDMCLSGETLIETDIGPVPIKEVRVGDRVLTRSGFHRVLASSMTSDSARVLEVEFLDGSRLRGTGNHPVFVCGKGFVRLDSLTKDDMMVSCGSRRFPGTAERGEDIRDRDTGSIGFISRDMRATSIPPSTFTGRSGGNSAGESPKDGTFITGMEIPSTIESAISSVCLRRGTEPSKAPQAFTAQRRLSEISTAFDTLRPRGIHQAREKGGTVKMERTPGRKERNRESDASPAARRSGLSGPRLRSFAPVAVRCATELREKEPVYNLRVESSGEYFANGILVHNCDSLTQGIIWGIEKIGRPFDPSKYSSAKARTFSGRAGDIASTSRSRGDDRRRSPRRVDFGSSRW